MTQRSNIRLGPIVLRSVPSENIIPHPKRWPVYQVFRGRSCLSIESVWEKSGKSLQWVSSLKHTFYDWVTRLHNELVNIAFFLADRTDTVGNTEQFQSVHKVYQEESPGVCLTEILKCTHSFNKSANSPTEQSFERTCPSARRILVR
jgi:hypothetical protein